MSEMGVNSNLGGGGDLAGGGSGGDFGGGASGANSNLTDKESLNSNLTGADGANSNLAGGGGVNSNLAGATNGANANGTNATNTPNATTPAPTTAQPNPWANMPPATQRRASRDFDAFYMVDARGKYAFYVRSPRQQKLREKRLNGMTYHAQITQRGTELFIAICENREWSILAALCEDLLATMRQPKCTAHNLLTSIDARLDEWQEFLKRPMKIGIGVDEKMRLFAELVFLRDVVAAQVGFEAGVNAWLAAQVREQSFALESSAVLVGAFADTSAKPLVKIAPHTQLYTDGARMYLAAYGLHLDKSGEAGSGKTCGELARQIIAQISELHVQQSLRGHMINRGIALIESGDNDRFSVTGARFFRVGDDFPRLPRQLPPQLLGVRYALDLAGCAEFAIDEIVLKERE